MNLTPDANETSRPSGSSGARGATGGSGATIALVLVACAAVGPVAWGATRSVLEAVRADGPTHAPAIGAWGLVALRTLLYPLIIGVLATALALPAAWVLRGGLSVGARRLGLILAVVPLMLPNYLAYSGWTLVRAPGTFLGDRLERGPEWVNLLAGRVLAVGGLALWAWPVAMLVLMGAAAAIPQSQVDALRLYAGRVRTARSVVRLMARPIGGSVLLVSLLMIGSPVPLHLAQAETLGVRLMAGLALTSLPGEVWLQSWPLVLLAVGAAWAVSGRAAAWRPPEPVDGVVERPGRAVRLGAAAAWVAAVIAPLALFVLSLRTLVSVWRFWKEAAASVRTSCEIALGVGVVVGLIALATWAAVGVQRRGWPARVARVVLGGLLVVAMLPGVLVGSAVRASFNAPWLGTVGDAVSGSGWIVVVAHAARFGFIGAACGWWLATLESDALRDARRLAGGETLAGWWRLAARPRVAAVVGVGLAAAALSLHEIESTIQVYPASDHPSLAQLVLDALHYLKQEQTSAAAVGMVVMALAAALAAGVLLSVTGVSRADRPGGAGSSG